MGRSCAVRLIRFWLVFLRNKLNKLTLLFYNIIFRIVWRDINIDDTLVIFIFIQVFLLVHYDVDFRIIVLEISLFKVVAVLVLWILLFLYLRRGVYLLLFLFIIWENSWLFILWGVDYFLLLLFQLLIWFQFFIFLWSSSILFVELGNNRFLA